MKTVNVIVFSITTSFFNLENTIKNFNNNKDILIITPHVPLDWEISKILSITNTKVIFKSFYEFISEEEMKFCDLRADKNIIQKYKKRELRLNEYFEEIKKLKNKIIINNIKKNYNLDEKWILANDLGINYKSWGECSFKSAIFFRNKKINFIHLLFNKIKSLINLYKNNPIYYLSFSGKKFYFFGKRERLKQYIDKKKVKFLNLPLFENVSLKLLLLINKFNFFPGFISLLLSIVLKKNKNINQKHVFTTLHSYSDNYHYITKALGSEMICLQDGLLPSNYSSYYKYLNVDQFFVWNNISSEIFKKNSLSSNIWSGFKKKKLPKIHFPSKLKIKNILFLTSGSGDWTALKNRSDEDLAYLALKKIAKQFSEIKFVYRPHPLWINPAHQGANSIERLIIDCKKNKLSNFEVSYNSLIEASNFQKENKKNVSFVSKSIENEIKLADIVLGDHSEALLNAAQKKKIIGSVSLARRKEFFYDYTSLGFPLMKTKNEIAKFINQVEKDLKFYGNYNEAIEKFNSIE